MGRRTAQDSHVLRRSPIPVSYTHLDVYKRQVHEGHLPEQDTVIRAACHYVNTREDIDRLVGALGELMG